MMVEMRDTECEHQQWTGTTLHTIKANIHQNEEHRVIKFA